eukprot:4465666-Pleurochrysis_carterae.AAC.1
MLWTLGSVPISTSSNSSLVQAACALAGGGMTAKKSDCQLSLKKGGIVGVFGAVAFRAFGDDVECRVEAEDVAVFIGAKEKRLVELVGLEFEGLETLILALEPSRSRRAGAATVATELKEAIAVNAVTWTTRLDSRRANRLAALVFCNMPPTKTVVA